MLARSVVVAVLPLLLATLCAAQEAPRPEVDRKDPQAVAAAFLAALDASDAQAASALLAGDDRFRAAWLEATQDMAEGMGPDGMTFKAMLTETSFLPVGWPAGKRETQAQVQDGEAVISLTERSEVQRKLILTRAEDGTWSVDFERSVTATTGLEHSFFVDDAMDYEAGGAEPGGMGPPGEGGPPGMGHDPRLDYIWRGDAMGVVAHALLDWAADHEGKLPPAESWLDDIEKWQLEARALQRPGAGEGECGYALNAALAGKALPAGAEERARLVLVYECADFDRNIVGDPEQELAPPESPAMTPTVALASGETLRVPPELTPSEALAAKDSYAKCRENVESLCEALRAYARAHDGLLPPGPSWCDDIEPYLRRAGAADDVFHCPGAPELEYGYALSAAMAGADLRARPDSLECILILPSVEGVRNEVRPLPPAVETPRHWDIDTPAPAPVAIAGDGLGNAIECAEGDVWE